MFKAATKTGKTDSLSGVTVGSSGLKSKKKNNDKTLTCRYELKYRISESTASAISSFIKPYLHVDKYALKSRTGDYAISSLYLDSDGLRLARDTMERLKNRFKLRIRIYSDDPASPCFFEVKRRINSVILKARARVTKNHILPILSGGLPEELYKEDRQAIRQFQLYKESLHARPMVLVKYDRQAFEGDTSTRVRVTFDRNLQYKTVTTPEVMVNGPGWNRVPISFVVLEIKFTEHYPAWLSDMVRLLNLKQTSFSKYVSSLKQSHSFAAGAPIMMGGI